MTIRREYPTQIINAELRHPVGVEGGVRAPVNSKLGREFENRTAAVKTVCGRLNDADANLINGPQMGIPPDRASKLPVGRQPEVIADSLWEGGFLMSNPLLVTRAGVGVSLVVYCGLGSLFSR